MKFGYVERTEKPELKTKGKYSDIHFAIHNLSDTDTLKVEFDTPEEFKSGLNSVRNFVAKYANKYDVWTKDLTVCVNIKASKLAPEA